MTDDPYVYPGTNVLRNSRGIRDGDELEKFETRLTFRRGLPVRSGSGVLLAGRKLKKLQNATL